MFAEPLRDLLLFHRQDPTNRILKDMLSGFYGHLSARSIQPARETKDPNGDVILDVMTDMTYRVMSKAKSYKVPVARIKPFILARNRRMMYERFVSKYASIITYFRTDGFQASEPLPNSEIS